MSFNCAQVRDLASELAFGVIVEPERTQMLSHLASCSDCQEHVSHLVSVADLLLILSPEVEPPAGFENRVLSQIGIKPPLMQRKKYIVASSVAAAIIMLLSVIGTHLLDQQHDRFTTQYVAALKALGGSSLKAAKLENAEGIDVGEVFVYKGHPSWMFISIDASGISGTAKTSLYFMGHAPIDMVGPRLVHGQGSWGSRIKMPSASVYLVRVSLPNFNAEAHLPS